VHLTLQIRRCLNRACQQVRRPYRSEAEGRLALPKPAFGLAVMADVGTLRSAPHRSLPAIHPHLRSRGVAVAPRTVAHLLERYDELLTLSLTDTTRLQRITPVQGRISLARDGLQPDVDHEGRWGLRACLSGAGLRARSVLSAAQPDLAVLLRSVRPSWPVPRVGSMSDGPLAIRRAVAEGGPPVPHQVCHCPALREAAKPSYEAARHAKQALQKRVRGVRPMERRLDGRRAPAAAVVRGDGAAGRRARTDDGRPPLDASGRTLHARLTARTARRERVDKRGPGPRPGGGGNAGWCEAGGTRRLYGPTDGEGSAGASRQPSAAATRTSRRR
jgi:hypothetical protein